MSNRRTRELPAPGEPTQGATGDPASEPVDFEQSLRDLEEIVARLEQGDLPLEESLKQFERGIQLTRLCQSALKNAEQKVEILLKKTGQLAPFESGNPPDADPDE